MAQTPSVGSAGPSQRLTGDPMDVAGVVNAVEPAVASIEVRYGNSAFGLAGIGPAPASCSPPTVTCSPTPTWSRAPARSSSRSPASPSPAGPSWSAPTPANDLALLHISGASGLPVAPLGRSADVAVGDDVVAIGNALGLQGGPSVTRGIISALGPFPGDRHAAP